MGTERVRKSGSQVHCSSHWGLSGLAAMFCCCQRLQRRDSVLDMVRCETFSHPRSAFAVKAGTLQQYIVKLAFSTQHTYLRLGAEGFFSDSTTVHILMGARQRVKPLLQPLHLMAHNWTQKDHMT